MLTVLAPFAAHAANCAALTDAVPAVAAAHVALLSVAAPEDLQTDVPISTQRGIAQLKDALGALIAARMQCAGADERAAAIVADLNAALRPLAAGCDAQCALHPYHNLPEFGAERTDDSRHLLAIVARQPIQCGHDAVLSVYESDGVQWRERLRWQAPRYDKVSGALEAFDWRISPPDATGGWYVLVKDIMPWCSSTWSSVRYAVLRPAEQANAPRVVFRAQHSLWWGNDDTGTIAAEANQFDVRFHAASIEPAVHNRVFIRHFAIDGEQVRRIPPVALTPRDFVDEWIVSKWADAALWSAPEHLSALEQRHARLHGPESPYFEFVAVRECRGAPGRVQVDVIDQRDQQEYFLLVDGATQFRMLEVSTQANARCGGEDLLPQMATE